MSPARRGTGRGTRRGTRLGTRHAHATAHDLGVGFRKVCLLAVRSCPRGEALHLSLKLSLY